MKKFTSAPLFRTICVTAAIAQLLLWPVELAVSKEEEPALTRATWLWDTKRIATESEDILSFLQQNGANLLYLQVNQENVAMKEYQKFLRLAHDSGIEVHALDGSPEWALHEHYHKLQAFADWVHQYNLSVPEQERFSGIHLDIEPYLLPRWKQNRSEVVREWMETTANIVSYIKANQQVQIGADLPFWLDVVPAGKRNTPPLSTWMIGKFDHVTLMAYRNMAASKDGIVEHVKHELKAAKALNKKVVVGVNIRQTSEAEKVTFAKKGKAEMERQLKIADALLRPYSSYAGQAVHDYESWTEALD